MRCVACNAALSDQESVRKSVNTGEYLDLCNSCIKDLDIAFVDNGSVDMIEDEEDERVSST